MRKKKLISIIRKVKKKVDDVAISGDMLRIEQMDDCLWWVSVYRGDKQVDFMFSSKSPIKCKEHNQDWKSIDDTKKKKTICVTA